MNLCNYCNDIPFLHNNFHKIKYKNIFSYLVHNPLSSSLIIEHFHLIKRNYYKFICYHKNSNFINVFDKYLDKFINEPECLKIILSNPYLISIIEKILDKIQLNNDYYEKLCQNYNAIHLIKKYIYFLNEKSYYYLLHNKNALELIYQYKHLYLDNNEFHFKTLIKNNKSIFYSNYHKSIHYSLFLNNLKNLPFDELVLNKIYSFL